MAKIPIEGVYTVNDNVVTFNPTGDLPGDKSIEVTITDGVRSLENQRLASSYLFGFTTSATAPIITTHPQSDSFYDGDSVELTVVADSNGGGDLTYQWEVNDGDGWIVLSGETSDTLSFIADIDNTGYQYRVAVTNDVGTTTSNTATITITEAPVGEILFGTHFDDEPDWNTSQDVSLLNDWDQKSAGNRGGDYEVGYIGQNGESSGKCFKQYWDKTDPQGSYQDCWLMKNHIDLPDEFWLGYRFKVDTNWDWGSVDHFKIMKLHFNNGTTWDIGWHSSDYGMTSPYTPPGGGLAIGTDAYGDNWFCSWTDIDDGAWHTFVWHFKHSTGVLELFVDGVDASLTSKSTAYVGTGWDDGTVSGYAISFGGNIEDGGGDVNEMWDKYDDVCIGTTREIVEEFLGI